MNFKILFVNGQDLSGSSHKEAVAAFEAASEPISVVLTRSTSPSSAQPIYGRSEMGTQTDLPCCNTCTCNAAALSESCKNAVNSLSALMSFQTVLQEQNIINCDESFDHDDDAVYNVEYQEAQLARSSNGEMLGITLCDGTNGYNDKVKVIVSEVSPDSIAGRCNQIREGDQILKVNGVPVNSTFEAGRLLQQENELITFLLARPRVISEERWSDDDVIEEEDEDAIDEEVTSKSNNEHCACESDEDVQMLERCQLENAELEFAAIVSQMDYKRYGNRFGSPDQAVRHVGAYSRTDTNGKDSGVGRTDESIQNSENGTLDSTVLPPCDETRFDYCSGSYNSSVCPSASHEFHYHKYIPKSDSKTTASRSSMESIDSAKGSSMDRSSVATSKKDDGEDNLDKAINKLEICSENVTVRPRRASNVQNLSDQANDNVSPWARMSLLIDEATDSEFADFDSKAELIANELITERWSRMKVHSPSDNSSSAYNTGESLSSATSPGSVDISPKPTGVDANHNKLPSRSNTEVSSPELVFSKSSFGGPECCLSSDANSDPDDTPCYVTHDDDNGQFSSSDCFEDAAIDFTLRFSSTSPTQADEDVSLRRLRSSEGTQNIDPNFQVQCGRRMSAPCGALPTKNAKLSIPPQEIVKNNVSKSEETISPSKRSKKPSRSQSRKKTSSRNRSSSGKRDRSGSETVVPVSTSTETASVTSNVTKLNHKHRKTRRSSESLKKEGTTYESCTTETGNDPNVEWKVRVRSDGTRYITKRPVRERILREREAKLNKERTGLTTDDDAMTELKLGKYWSRDERKKHLDRVREHKKRRDFMQRCRLDALRESGNEEDIVKLSHQKMLRSKNKRMLDDFMTVQEILAHGNHTLGPSQQSPFLTVTYI